jgi:hypothetical protein
VFAKALEAFACSSTRKNPFALKLPAKTVIAIAPSLYN